MGLQPVQEIHHGCKAGQGVWCSQLTTELGSVSACVRVVPQPGTHPVVLIGCHCHKLGLSEGEGLEVLMGKTLAVLTWVHEHDMEAGLVPVHGIQDDLRVQRGGEHCTEMGTRAATAFYLIAAPHPCCHQPRHQTPTTTNQECPITTPKSASSPLSPHPQQGKGPIPTLLPLSQPIHSALGLD